MKKYLQFLVILLSTISTFFAQIDSTNWYPLQVGNKWFYSENAFFDGEIKRDIYTVEVTGDTLMPNLKRYQILNNKGYKNYQRNSDNDFVFEYNKFDSTEFKLYDFISPDKTIWENPRDDWFDYSIRETIWDFNDDSTIGSGWKLFEWVTIDTTVIPIDTIWGSDYDYWTTCITRGIGLTSISSHISLVAAIIKGDTLGIIPPNKINVEKDILKFVNEIDTVQYCSFINEGYQTISIDSITHSNNWKYKITCLKDDSIRSLPFNLNVKSIFNLKVSQYFSLAEFIGKEVHILDTLSIHTSFNDIKSDYVLIADMKAGVVSVSLNQKPVNKFVLSQNYPNPFNPSTTIEYSIPTPPASSPLVKGRTGVGFVQLKIYNPLGQEVATIVNEKQPPGTYKVTFDASQLPSGVYLYRLQAGEFSTVKKLMLLK